MSDTITIEPPIKAARHYLYEIDREKKTAFCTACGRTEIHIPKSRTSQNPKIFCVKRYQQHTDAEKDKRRSKPGWKPRHILSEINAEKMTATCSVCGPAKIRKRPYKEAAYYACATTDRAYGRTYRRTHYVASLSNPHALSKIDEEKRTAVCASCGPVAIEVVYGKKKINRRCINARSQVLSNSRSPEKGIENNAHETL